MTTDSHAVTSHSQDTEPQNWPKVKGQLISKFTTVNAAAKKARCHPNSFRLAATHGQCPRIIKWLKEHHVSL